MSMENRAKPKQELTSSKEEFTSSNPKREIPQFGEAVLAPIEEQMLHAFSRQLTEDDEWRAFARPSDSAFAWLTQRNLAQSLGWSYTQGVFLANGRLIGLITADWVDSSWVTADAALDNNSSVLECGTYLLKGYRRMGLNAQIKRATLEWAAGLGAEWVVYVVPQENTAAVKSLRREFPAHEYAVSVSGVHDAGNRENHGDRDDRDDREARHRRFSAWLKYREWKQGSKLVIFAIPCGLKNH